MEALCRFFKKGYALGMHQGITTCVNKWKRIRRNSGQSYQSAR